MNRSRMRLVTIFRLLVACLACLATGVAAASNYQGLWYASPAESESGWGINFAHQGDVIFATWFTYDATGRGWWLSMTANRTAESAYTGTIVQTRGPAFSAVPFSPSAVSVTPVGSGTLAFASERDGRFSYTVNGISQEKAITRQVFDTQPSCVFGLQADLANAINYQDLWWASPPESESGWGVNFTHQGDVIFATWFTYDSTGAPMWLVAEARRTGPARFAGALLRTTGPAFNAVPFTPSAVSRTTVGSLTISFLSGNAGTFQYTVDGITQTKAITRQVFRPPGTACQFAEGVWTGTTDQGQAATVAVLPGGAHYVYWGPPGGSGGHVLQGTARMDGGAFSSSDAIDYPIARSAETNDRTSPYTIAGTYVPGGPMVLTLESGNNQRTVTATYQAGSTGAPSLAEVAGNYRGISGHVNGRRTATIAVNASGTITGGNDVCTFNGTMTPRAAPRVFDFTLSGPSCIFGGTITGIAQYDPAAQELRFFAPYDSRSDLYYIIGVRNP